MTTQQKQTSLSDLLLEARKNKTPLEFLPPELAPQNAPEAYAIQDRVTAQLGPIQGWKVGAPSPTGEPFCAPIVASQLFTSPASVRRSDHNILLAESEVAFQMKYDLGEKNEPYTPDDMMDAIESIHPTLELIDTRFKGGIKGLAPLPMLADNQICGALLYGPGRLDWTGFDFFKPAVSLSINDRVIAHTTNGNPGGEPLRLLTWLANHGVKRGKIIKKGQILTTGSHIGAHPVQAGQSVTAQVEGLAPVRLHVTA